MANARQGKKQALALGIAAAVVIGSLGLAISQRTDRANERQITTDTSWQGWPDIWMDRWRSFDDDDVADNYLYDTGTGREVKLTSDRDVSHPKVSDRYVVYIQYDKHHRFGQVANESIFVYDIRQGVEVSVDVPTGTKNDVEIWGSRIVWSELRDPAFGTPNMAGSLHCNADIYVLDLGSNDNEPGHGTCLAGTVVAFLILGVSVPMVWKRGRFEKPDG